MVLDESLVAVRGIEPLFPVREAGELQIFNVRFGSSPDIDGNNYFSFTARAPFL
jgi:hypothetical protein